MSALCIEYGVSRKTAYKHLKRWQAFGDAGLEDAPRGARTRPNRTPAEIEAMIVREKRRRLSWGSKKLVGYLRRKHEGIELPARSTIDEILKRSGLVTPRRRRRLVPTHPDQLSTSRAPNDVWCVDFKGQFRLGDGRYCYALTITDHYSRFLIACVGLEGPTADHVFRVFDEVFKKYGLPKAIRSDNGIPFASRGLGGLSQLSAWWVSLGILPERIEPGHPEQNGRHERMHRTLKEETTRPAAATMIEQQRLFDAFVTRFNWERPHEALDMKTPGDVYQRSETAYPCDLASVQYPLHDRVYRVSANGVIWPNCATRRGIFLTRAIGGHNVGLREVSAGRWLITFATIDLGYVENHEFEPLPILVRVRDERAHLSTRPKEGAPSEGVTKTRGRVATAAPANESKSGVE